MPECLNCGYDNPGEARFCSQCGASLESSERRRGERRQITVAFSDLSGFTAMSEHMDPEDVQTVMGHIFSAATEIIERYSGRVDKLLGDAVMSVFGDPVAHEDDAERAVRATLEIHAMVDKLSPEYEAEIGRPLRMHSGINTGVVVTSFGSVDTADAGPLGDTINLAARLEDLSESGEILLGPETAHLVESVFELTGHGAHELKGKSGQMPVVRVAGFKRERTGPSRRQAKFVGRHEELGTLLAAVEKVQDSEGSVIGIRAEAGAGKSRLLDEFHSKVDDKVQWLEGRAYAYGENIPYAPLVDLISNAIDVGEDDTQESIAGKIRKGIGELVDHNDRTLDPFIRLYGLPEREGAALDKDSFQDRLLESLVAVVDGLCKRAPTVLVLQDLHWADPSTVGIFRDLIATMTSPVVTVVNYRPAFDDALPGLREVELGALSPRQSGHMVASLLDGADPPEGLVDFIVERTDGNPFYVEEIINSLLETSTLARSNGAWRIDGPLADADIPTSVRGVIASRIDRLDDDRRRVLREASVVGREFLYEVIKRVATATETLDSSLADLETADLIRERGHDEDLEYFFKHALTQDVAYEGLLKPERTKLHARAAAAIEAQFSRRLEEVTETLAYHYTEGAVLDKAVHYLRAAGRKAMDRYALVEAQAHYEKAYQLIVASGESTELDHALVDLVLDWAILFYYQAHLLKLGELLDRHQDAVDRLDDDTSRMWWLIWRGHVAVFGVDQSDNMRLLDEALEIAEATGDADGIAYAKTWMTWGLFVTGDLRGAINMASDIEEWVMANRHEDPYPYFKSRMGLAWALASAGQGQQVTGMCREVIAFGQRVGNNRCIAFGHVGLSFLETTFGNYSSAIAHAEKAGSIAKDPIYRDAGHIGAAVPATLAGDAPRARQAVDNLLEAVETGVELPFPIHATIAEALTMMSEGELTAGIEQLFDARDEAKQMSRKWEWLFAEFFIAATFARIVTGEATATLGRLARNPRFIPYLRQARKEALSRLRAIQESAVETGFKGMTPVAEVEMAKLLIHTGDKAEARRLLDSALAVVSEFGEGESTERIRALLATT